LHPPQALPRIEDEVVRFTIAPGFGDSEPEAGGFVKESEFESSPRGLGQSRPRTIGVFMPVPGLLVGLPIALNVGQVPGRGIPRRDRGLLRECILGPFGHFVLRHFSFSIPHKKGASRISGRACYFCLLSPDYQIGGGKAANFSSLYFHPNQWVGRN
jgi:hypothetical protein